MPRKRYEKRKEKFGLEKASPWTKVGKRGGQGGRYPSTGKRTLPRTTLNQSFWKIFPFSLFSNVLICLKKQLIRRPTKSKRLKGSKNRYGITIDLSPKKTEAEKTYSQARGLGLPFYLTSSSVSSYLLTRVCIPPSYLLKRYEGFFLYLFYQQPFTENKIWHIKGKKGGKAIKKP